MNFGTLKSRTREYLEFEAADIDTKVGNWVNDTRKDLALKHRFGYLITEAYMPMVDGTARYALPTDYLGHLQIALVNKSDSKMRQRVYKAQSPGFHADQYHQDVASGHTAIVDGGVPVEYVEYGTEFELVPTPNALVAASYNLNIWYYAQPSDFTNAADVDHISRYHFEAIIWGACLRGARYLDDDFKKQEFQNSYTQAIAEMIKREKEMTRGDLNPRMKHWRDFQGNYGAFRAKAGIFNVR